MVSLSTNDYSAQGSSRNMPCGGRKGHLLLPFIRSRGQLCKSWVWKDLLHNFAIAGWKFQTGAPSWCIAKLGGAGGKFGEHLFVDCNNLHCVSECNKFTNTKFIRPTTQISKSIYCRPRNASSGQSGVGNRGKWVSGHATPH